MINYGNDNFSSPPIGAKTEMPIPIHFFVHFFRGEGGFSLLFFKKIVRLLKSVKILSFVKILLGILGIENKFYILMEEVLYISI